MKASNSYIKDLPKTDRPRERMISLGPGSLSIQELISILIGSGTRNKTVTDISKSILLNYDLPGLSIITVSELKNIPGISDAKACQIAAAIELGKRIASKTPEQGNAIKGASDVAEMFFPVMKDLRREVLKCVLLNSRLCFLKEETVSSGGLNSSAVTIETLFRTAITESAAAMILVHNHPSGSLEPSKKDKKFTKKAIAAANILGIEILDHIIISSSGYLSMKEQGHL